MPGSKVQPLSTKARRYAQMKAQDCSYEEIRQELFGIDPDAEVDPKEDNRIRQQMWRWRNHPDFFNVFDAEIERILRMSANEAVNVLKGQLRDKSQPWLQNKAANDLMNHRKTALQKDENQITVKVEGMPTLGTPDQD